MLPPNGTDCVRVDIARGLTVKTSVAIESQPLEPITVWVKVPAVL